MLSALNLKLIKPTWSRCVGKQVTGHCRLVGGTFSIQFSSRAVPMGRDVPSTAAQGKPVPWTPLFRFPIKTD